MPPSLALPNDFEGFPQQVISSFRDYHDKDSLHIITVNDCKEFPTPLKKLMDLGISRTYLDAILSLSSSLEAYSPPIREDIVAADEYSQAEVDAIIVIQHLWRRRLSRIQEDRRLRESSLGMITECLVNLCATHIPAEYPPKSKIRIRASLLTEGVQLLTVTEEVAQTMQLLQDNTALLLEDGDVAHLELLESVLPRIRKCETTFGEIETCWSPRNLERNRWWLDNCRLEKKVSGDIQQLELVREECHRICQLLELPPNSEP